MMNYTKQKQGDNMFFTKIAKYMCIFTLIMLPNFSFAAMHGLKGYYYDNADFTGGPVCRDILQTGPTGTPYASRTQNGSPWSDENNRCYYVDPNIDFGWGDNILVPPYKNHPKGQPLQIEKGSSVLKHNWWSVKWKGALKLPDTANYNFFIKYKTKYTLKIDDRIISSKEIAGVAHEWRSLSLLSPGENYSTFAKGYHKFELDFVKEMGEGFIRLGYTINNPTPKQNEIQPIPESWFFTEIPRTVKFTQTSFSAQESDGEIEVSVEIDELPKINGEIKVAYETFDKDPSFPRRAEEGIDYTKTKGVLTWQYNSSKIQTFKIPILSDSIDESTELFDINLTQYGNHVVSIKTPNAVGQIYDVTQDVEVEFSQPYYEVKEGNILSIPVILNKPAPEDLSIDFSFIDGTANFGVDYAPITTSFVDFPKGSKTAIIKVNIIDEGHMEKGSEDFKIKLGNPPLGLFLGTNDITTVTIIDSENVNLCFNQSIDSEGDAKKDGWRLIDSSHEVTGTDFTIRRSVGLFGNFWRTNVTKPYYAKHPANSTSRLRLTDGFLHETFAVAYDPNPDTYKGFKGSDNYMIVEFDHFAYGGCVYEPLKLTANVRYGGDGMAMVLYDANEKDLHAGAFGGALGYAQRGGLVANHAPGFSGGWIGLGIDESGIFSSSGLVAGAGEGKKCKLGKLCPKEKPLGLNTMFANKVVLRGSEPDYGFLAHSISFSEDKGEVPVGRSHMPRVGRTQLVSNIENDIQYTKFETVYGGKRDLKNGVHPTWPRTPMEYVMDVDKVTSATDYFSGRYRLKIDNRFKNHTYISVERYIPKPADYRAGKVVDEDNMDWEVVISEFDAQADLYKSSMKPLPEYLKLAFTASNSDLACNIRELGNIVIKANDCGVKEEVNNFRVIEESFAKMDATKAKVTSQAKLWNWKWNSPLRTKIARNEGRYCVLSGTSNDENATWATEDKKVKIRLITKQIIEDADGSFKEEWQMPSVITPPASFNPDVNGSFILTEANANKPTAYCFDYPKNPNSPSANEIIYRNAYFSIAEINSENKQIGHDNMISSDFFSIRPKDYNIKFSAKDLAENIKKGDNNETILISDKEYEYSINARYFDSNNSTNGYFRILPSRAVDKGFSKYQAILEDNATTLICPEDRNLTIGKETISDPNLYKLAFRNGDAIFKSSDNVKEPSTKMSFKYNNTMRFDPRIEDTNWTFTDFNMTKFKTLDLTSKKDRIKKYGLECIPNIANFNTHHELTGTNKIDLQDINRTRELGQNIFCDINETYPSIYVIPSHFVGKLKGLNDAVVRGTDSFTYVSTEENLTHPTMSADMNLTIQAMTFLDNVATNYKELCYANDVDFNITFAPHKNPSRTALASSDINLTNERRETYLAKPHIWYAGDKYDTNTTHFVRKTPTSTDENATFRIMNKDFKNGEANASVSFNFKRRPNLALEPFSISDRDFDLIGISDANYTNRNLNSEAMPRNKGVVYDINATKMGFTTTHKPNTTSPITNPTDNFFERPTAESNATFYTARAYTPDYKGTIGTPIDGTTYYGVYCQECDKAQYDLDTFMSIPLQPLWLVNERHNQLSPDGNISSYESVGSGIKNTMTIPSTRQSSTAMTLGRERLEFRSNTPGIDTIKMNMSPWLVYIQDPTSMVTNPNNANITFNVQFYDQSEWGGEGRIDGASEVQGATVDVNESITNRPSRKMSW